MKNNALSLFSFSILFSLAGCTYTQTYIDDAKDRYRSCLSRINPVGNGLVLMPSDVSSPGSWEVSLVLAEKRLTSQQKLAAKTDFAAANSCFLRYSQNLPERISNAKRLYFTALEDFETLQVDLLSDSVTVKEYNQALRARKKRLNDDIRDYESRYNAAVMNTYRQISSQRSSYETRRLSRDIRDLEDRLDALESQKRNRDFQCIRSGGVPVYGGCM